MIQGPRDLVSSTQVTDGTVQEDFGLELDCLVLQKLCELDLVQVLPLHLELAARCLVAEGVGSGASVGACVLLAGLDDLHGADATLAEYLHVAGR